MINKRYGLRVLMLLGLVLGTLGPALAVTRVVAADDLLNGGDNNPGDPDDEIEPYKRGSSAVEIRQFELRFNAALEFGDAPEGAPAYPAMGVLGAFPTCINCGPAGWVQHTNFGAWFGPAFDLEPEGNAGNCPLFTPNTYDADECFADGDAGLRFPQAYTIRGPVGSEVVVPCPGFTGTPLGAPCRVALWGVDVDIDVTNLMPSGAPGFVNVLIDWNGDGQWRGASDCATPGDTPEHVLVDFPVPNGFVGPLSLLGPPPFLIGPRPGYAWARFTISERPVGHDWNGEGSFEDGESEDYLLEIRGGLDFGDAPDPTYPTLLASNGARHVIDGRTYLGASVDADPDGQPDPAAMGDDNDGNDDEDGVAFTSGLVRGATATLDVTASTPGILNAWLDLNSNGNWQDAGEHIFVDTPLAAGVNNLAFGVPLGATPGPTYARFRFSTMGGLWYDGPAPDGEVEDYQVVIESPPPIGVDLSKRLLEPPGGAAVISDTIRFQVLVTNTGGTAWVTNPFTDTFDACMSFVRAYQDGTLVLVGPGSPLTWDLAAVNGGPIVPGQVVVIDLYFHADAGGICWNRAEVLEIDRFGQRAEDGDSAFVVIGEPFEFGDAPEGALAYPATGVLGAFPTCINCGPAGWVQHTNFGAWFGPAFDLEPEGNAGNCPLFTPNMYDADECFADGDAGLLFPEAYTIRGAVGNENVVPCPGFTGTPLGATCRVAVWGVDVDIDVTNLMPSGAPGFVNVLIDWNGDGRWGGASGCATPGDTPEHVLMDFLVPPGFVGRLSALGPLPFLIGPRPGYAWARFTISERPVGHDWNGEGAFEDGESEDYLLEIRGGLDFGDAPDPTYPTLLASNGARHVIDGWTYLGASVDAEPDGQPDPAAMGDDNDGNDDEDGVAFTSGLVRGAAATLDVTASTPGILNAWLDLNGNGTWQDAGEHIFVDTPLAAGVNNLSFGVPLGATPGPTYARFRFSTMGGLWYDGPAPDGEVEDYQVVIESPPPIGVDLSKTLLEPPGGVAVISDTIRFQVLVTNTGGTAWVTNPFTDTFDACMSFARAYQDGTPVLAGPGSPLTWDLAVVNGGPIVPGQVVVIDLYFHADAGGICRNQAEVLEIDRFGQRAEDRDAATVIISTPPTISGLPNVIADHTTSLPVTIDLWAYASDNETPDSGLAFTIEGSPPSGAGVSIVGNRWLTVNPSTQWCGYANITVRVTDPGGLWDNDTFRVAVSWSCPG